jgi:hypothetical protein
MFDQRSASARSRDKKQILNQITIRTDRNADFQGQLGGGTIRGKMFIRDATGAVVNTADVMWHTE